MQTFLLDGPKEGGDGAWDQIRLLLDGEQMAVENARGGLADDDELLLVLHVLHTAHDLLHGRRENHTVVLAVEDLET